MFLGKRLGSCSSSPGNTAELAVYASCSKWYKVARRGGIGSCSKYPHRLTKLENTRGEKKYKLRRAREVTVSFLELLKATGGEIGSCSRTPLLPLTTLSPRREPERAMSALARYHPLGSVDNVYKLRSYSVSPEQRRGKRKSALARNPLEVNNLVLKRTRLLLDILWRDWAQGEWQFITTLAKEF